MLKIRNILLRLSSILFAVGLSFVLAECPRIGGRLRLSTALFIAVISIVSSLGLWLTTLTYTLKYRRFMMLALIPSVFIMPMIADYYSPYLLGPALVVLMAAFYNIFSSRRGFFFDLHTQNVMTDEAFAVAIQAGKYDNYIVKKIHGRLTPVSKRDHDNDDNLG